MPLHPCGSRRLSLALAMLSLVALVGWSGCADPVIPETPEQIVFAAEQTWVQAKSALADSLLELQAAGIELSPEVKAKIALARDGGNAAVDAAWAAIDSGERDLNAGALAQALRNLRSFTATLQSQREAL